MDVSNTMLFTSQRKLKAEYAAELAFNLAVATVDNGEAVGYALFNTQIIARSMPGIGKEAIYNFAAALSNPKNYGGEKNLHNVLMMLNVMLKQRSLIIFVSDFIGMQEGWERYVRILSEKYDLLGIMIRDPRDRVLPQINGQFLVEDPLGNDRLYVDIGDYREIFAKEVNAEEEYIKKVFETAKAGLICLSTDQDLLTPVLSYLRKRSKLIKS
jgi:uncharacterized protein (DUF58 family)